MRRIMTIALAVWAAVAGLAQAQSNRAENPVIVELYTSQGCAACPPVDDYFAKIAGRDDVIALSLHVDYWDYIGWSDSFANPAFTKRQKGYARAAGTKSIFTPQLVIGGQDHVVGNKPDQIDALVRAHGAKQTGVRMVIERVGDILTITATATPPLSQEASVQIVRYVPQATVAIERGENAGRTVEYHNVVSSWTGLGIWPGGDRYAAEVAVSGDEPIVVIIQLAMSGGPGEILAAARLR